MKEENEMFYSSKALTDVSLVAALADWMQDLSDLHTHTKDQEHADAGWWVKIHYRSLLLTSI